MPWSAFDHQQRNFWGYVRSGMECTVQGNDFELIPTIKMEIYFGREFAAICYHCGVLAAWSRQDWNIFKKYLRYLKRPLMIKFSKFSSESLHRDTDRHCCVQNSWKLSNGKSVKSCYLGDQKKTKTSAPSQTVTTARIAPKVCRGQPPTFHSQSSDSAATYQTTSLTNVD